MKMIPSSVPVFIQDLESQNGKYSKAKLKVFYIGETPDHRLFTKDFAEEVIKTLPLTPVVGYYDTDEEDFVGHNKTQYVYGLVPETAELTFELDDNGVEWLVTDVILYTGRKDNIGEVASKIAGKQHSLELNPDTLQYKINRDQFGRFKNIEFQKGEFVGLSVLGDAETPAFTNSGFFTASDEFQDFAAECHQNFDRFLAFLNKNGGNIEVMEFSFNQFLEKVAEAAKLTMQEFQNQIYRWMDNNCVLGYIIENTEEYALLSVYEDGEQKLYRYDIVINEDEVNLGNREQVFVRYLTQEQIDAENFAKKADENEDEGSCEQRPEEDDQDKQDEQPVVSEPEEEQPEEEQPQDDQPSEEQDKDVVDEEDNDDEDEDDKKKPAFIDSAADENFETVSEGVQNATQIQGVQEEEETSEQVGETTTSSSFTTLTDSERIELEEFRRQAKINAINEYRGDVDEQTLTQYIENVDKYSIEQLYNELNKVFRTQSKAKATVVAAETKSDNSVAVTAFQIISTGGSTYDENNPADVIQKYKNK